MGKFPQLIINKPTSVGLLIVGDSNGKGFARKQMIKTLGLTEAQGFHIYSLCHSVACGISGSLNTTFFLNWSFIMFGSSSNTRERAIGWINLFVTNKNGKKTKIGAIPLNASNNNEKVLNDWLAANPEANAATLLANMSLIYNSGTPAAASIDPSDW